MRQNAVALVSKKLFLPNGYHLTLGGSKESPTAKTIYQHTCQQPM